MKRSVKWLTALVAALAVFLVLPSDRSLAGHTTNQIDVCCAWNGALSGGVLTYSISGGASVDQDTVRVAVENWEVVPGLKLTEVPSTDKTANIKIKMSKGGGVVAGMAKRNFDRNWFIKSVNLSISLKAFGRVNDQAILAEVTRHEMGHALGLNHANFDDLMDPTVGGETKISACDVDAVVAANHWKLADRSDTPHQPHVTHVGC